VVGTPAEGETPHEAGTPLAEEETLQEVVGTPAETETPQRTRTTAVETTGTQQMRRKVRPKTRMMRRKVRPKMSRKQPS
jgi:IS5 family transposase